MSNQEMCLIKKYIYPIGTSERAVTEKTIVSDYLQRLQEYCVNDLSYLKCSDFLTPFCDMLHKFGIHEDLLLHGQESLTPFMK